MLFTEVVFKNKLPRDIDKAIIPLLKTGLDDVDSITTGIRASETILVSGLPSSGKTSFSINLAYDIASLRLISTAFISTTLSFKEMASRVIHSQDNATAVFEATPLYLEEANKLSISELKDKITELRRNHLVQVLFIDSLDGYYQHIPSSSGLRITSLYELVREMDLLAKSLSITIFMTLQIKPDNELFKEIAIASTAVNWLLGIEFMESLKDDNKRCISVSTKAKDNIGNALVMFNKRKARFYNCNDKLNDEPQVPEE